MTSKKKRITYHKKMSKFQETVFDDYTSRIIVVSKGRRLGFTEGAVWCCIKRCLSEQLSILWGDTTFANIKMYYEDMFCKELNNICAESNIDSSKLYHWSEQIKRLRIGKSTIDFRSSDNPKNWEGHKYDLIILNEAGIILENRYLWDNAVSPMLLDNPKSQAIIGGTPKGKNMFYELHLQASNCTNGTQKAYFFSTYDNPFLEKEEIDNFVATMDSSVVEQEIYGKFIDSLSHELFKYTTILESMDMNRYADGYIFSSEEPIIWGLDVARHGKDRSVLAKRRGMVSVFDITEMRIDDLYILSETIARAYSTAIHNGETPDAIFVDVNGMGYGVHDMLVRQYGLPVVMANSSNKASVPIYYNKRTEMYKLFSEALESGLKLPDNNSLKDELSKITYKYHSENILRIVGKEELRTKLGKSPDIADAIALTFYSPVFKRKKINNINNKTKNYSMIGGLKVTRSYINGGL